jgi:hypothetical protein
MTNATVTTATANARGEDRRLEDGCTGLPCQPGIRSTGQLYGPWRRGARATLVGGGPPLARFKDRTGGPGTSSSVTDGGGIDLALPVGVVASFLSRAHDRFLSPRPSHTRPSARAGRR